MPHTAPHTAPDPDDIRAVIAPHLAQDGALLPALHAVQHAFGCVPDAAQPVLAEALNLSRAEVRGVVSFYHDFRRSPAGRRVVKLCRAEACQAMGGAALADRLLTELGIGWGDTTADGALTLEPVYCLGLCACGPAALVDDRPVGRATAETLLAEAAR